MRSFVKRNAPFSSNAGSNGKSTDSSDPPTSAPDTRGDQARGAMRDYLQNVGKPTGKAAGEKAAGAAEGASLWERLRRDIDQTSKDAGGNARSRTTMTQSSPPSSSSPSKQQQTPRSPRPQGSSNTSIDKSSTTGSQAIQRRPRQSIDSATTQESEAGAAGSSRQFNMRSVGDGGAGGKKKKPTMKKGKASDAGERRSRDDARDTGDSIPPAMQALLFDHEYFEKEARSGKVLDTADMDGIDQFLADFYMESSKSKTGECRAVFDSAAIRRVVIPQARPMQQLLASMTPSISAAAVGSLGFELGCTAWDVVSKNTYYSDSDREYIANGIARETEAVYAYAYAAAAERNGPPDLIFQPGFKKGLQGIEDEKRRKSMEDAPVVDDFKQAATDWSQQAVVDEDLL